MQAGDGWLDDASAHLVHECLVGKTHGRYRAHAACVQARVTLANALVVLGNGQQAVVLAVGDDKHRALNALKELLDDHRCARLAKLAVEHCAEFTLGLVQIVDDEHALAGCQTVGLEHIGCLLTLEEAQSLVQIVVGYAQILRRGDAMPLHEALGKVLAALQLGTGGAGANHHDVA